MLPSTETRRGGTSRIDPTARTAAFSLVELLVGVVIFGLLCTGIATVLSSDLRSTRNLQTYQRLRGQVSRARRFLELESSAASRLQWQNANSLLLSGVTSSGAFTITYDLVAAASAGVSGVTFRGPFVLRRSGPPYTADGTLANSAGTSTVLLDGLQSNQAFTITAPQTSSDRSARVAINLSEQGTTYTSDFSLATAAPTSFGLLQFTGQTLSGCNGSPSGCRQVTLQGRIIQEWDTRALTGSSPITITPAGSPAEVIIYFDAPRPNNTNAIRRAQSSSSGTCIRSGCFVDFGSGSAYFINSANSRVDKLVFRDRVINVPRQ